MQTIQLLPDRPAFLAAVRRHLLPGGLLAIAIAAALEDFGDLEGELPAAGRRRRSRTGASRRSRPRCARCRSATRIERVRRMFGPDGAVTEEDDVIELAVLTTEALEDEGRAAGFTPEPALLDRADRRARRLRGGAAACLSGRCACSRSIRT